MIYIYIYILFLYIIYRYIVEISFTFQASGCRWLRIARLACLVSRHRAWQGPRFGAWPRAAACAKLMARTSSWLKIAARALHGASVSNPNTPRLPMLTTSSLAKSHTGLEIAGWPVEPGPEAQLARNGSSSQARAGSGNGCSGLAQSRRARNSRSTVAWSRRMLGKCRSNLLRNREMIDRRGFE